MTIQSWTGRIVLTGTAAITAATIVEAVSSLVGKRASAHVEEYYRPDSSQVMLYFPALATDAIISAVEFLPLFERDSVLLVDYPRTGISRQATFKLLEEKLRRYVGKDLLIYAVSFGSGVALDFRRYMKMRPQLKEWFPQVRFILHSPVTAGGDVIWHLRVISYLGFVFRGGLVSDLASGLIISGLLRVARSKRFGSVWFLDKMGQLKAALEALPMRLIASELRTVHYGRRSRREEFADDSALILYGAMEDVVTQNAPKRLAQAFGKAYIVEEDIIGHADIAQAVKSGGLAKALRRSQGAV